jgi:hypothetical protein
VKGASRSVPAINPDEVKQQLKLPEVGQIGVVVEDLYRAVAFYQCAVGRGPFRIQEAEIGLRLADVLLYTPRWIAQGVTSWEEAQGGPAPPSVRRSRRAEEACGLSPHRRDGSQRGEPP